MLEKRSKEKGKLQPVIVCGTDDGTKEGIFFILVDNKLIKTSNNFLNSFETLLKFHYIFDISYLKELEKFYNVIATILKLEEPTPLSKLFIDKLDKF